MLAVPAVKFWVRLSELFSAPLLVGSRPMRSRTSLMAWLASSSAWYSESGDGEAAWRLTRLPV